jgi:hypothetical protein
MVSKRNRFGTIMAPDRPLEQAVTAVFERWSCGDPACSSLTRHSTTTLSTGSRPSRDRMAQWHRALSVRWKAPARASPVTDAQTYAANFARPRTPNPKNIDRLAQPSPRIS